MELQSRTKRHNFLVDENMVRLHEELRGLPKVTIFLRSLEKNSRVTSTTYETSLAYLQSFLVEEYGHTLQSILEPIIRNEFNVYTLLEQFVTFLMNKCKSLSDNSVRQYLVGIKSYLAYYDIDVIPSKFKRKVKMPKRLQEDQEPIDVKDIRNILLNCSNRRLKTFILILASGGMRATEAVAIRNMDIDFTVSPVKIHIRKEYSKTRVSRDIYISEEASKYLRDWLSWKYRHRKNLKEQHKIHGEDLVFQVQNLVVGLKSIYVKLRLEFIKVLSTCGLDEKKEGMRRRKISFHSFRRFVKTVISDQVNQDYSEWFLGHNKSPYYTKKEPERREIYASKCMKYLTFLDYSTLESTGKSVEARLQEKEKEITYLRERDTIKEDTITSLSDKLVALTSKLEELGIL